MLYFLVAFDPYPESVLLLKAQMFFNGSEKRGPERQTRLESENSKPIWQVKILLMPRPISPNATTGYNPRARSRLFLGTPERTAIWPLVFLPLAFVVAFPFFSLVKWSL